MPNYAYQERIAICLESGVPPDVAKRIADSERPKEKCEAVKRIEAVRAKRAQASFDKFK